MLENDINSFPENIRKMVRNICFIGQIIMSLLLVTSYVFLNNLISLIMYLGSRFFRSIASSSREDYGMGVLWCK